MRKIVRINGSNGVIYEEQMTEEQIRKFLHFVDLDDEGHLGVGFHEWTVQIVERAEQIPAEKMPGRSYCS